MDVKIDETWKKILKEEFDKPYFENIVLHLKTERSQGKVIYPPGSLIFNAFNTTPFDKVKGCHPWTGSLSRPAPGTWPLLFGTKWSSTSPITGKYF